MTAQNTPHPAESGAEFPKKSARELDQILHYRGFRGDDFACKFLHLTQLELEHYTSVRGAQLAANREKCRAKWLAGLPQYTPEQLAATGLSGTDRQIMFALQIRAAVGIPPEELACELDATYWIARAKTAGRDVVDSGSQLPSLMAAETPDF